MPDFVASLIAWQKRHGRHDLPWQGTRDPYRIWVSEIMLQQTQVATVIPYFRRWLARFPDVVALAAADEGDALALWSGLGYYARGRNLHRAAREIVAHRGGKFPGGFDEVARLPGVGRSTASAIAAFAYGERRAILDGNVKRVLARRFGIEGFPGDAAVERELWTLAESLLPDADIETYTQALMDLGATVCTRAKPRCMECPIADECVALRECRTAELPQRRPRKPLPLRRTVMLVFARAGEVLLVRRPPAGIWGGLWCFPELTPGGDFAAVARDRFGLEVTFDGVLPTLTHTFTHFRLDIEARCFVAREIRDRAMEPGASWMDIADAKGAAIPTPVRAILGRLAAD